MEKEFLVKGPITPAMVTGYLEALSSRKDAGAHSLFLGQVRNDAEGDSRVAAIEYSAYDEMVRSEGGRIIENTLREFPDIKDIEIVHSTGLVRAGEISLLVLVTAGHRDQATRGCRHVVEMIKANYPVWKKELFEDESHRWKENE